MAKLTYGEEGLYPESKRWRDGTGPMMRYMIRRGPQYPDRLSRSRRRKTVRWRAVAADVERGMGMTELRRLYGVTEGEVRVAVRLYGSGAGKAGG